MPKLSEKAQTRIAEWGTALMSLPTVAEVETLVESVAEDEIDAFCQGFGRSSAELALFLSSMINLTDEVNAKNESDAEEMKLVLSGQALDRCRELAAEVLKYVDLSEATIDMVDLAKTTRSGARWPARPLG
jgi:hypothetical protein